jgi:hypothetical protein
MNEARNLLLVLVLLALLGLEGLLVKVDDLELGDDEGLNHLLGLLLVLHDDGVEVLAKAELELVLANIALDLDVCRGQKEKAGAAQA